MTEVFISYKREDRDKAHALAEAIASKGYDVWWDVDLLPGEKFADEIKSIIRSAKAAVVLWSEESVQSTFVTAEARLALREGILIPVWLNSSEPPLPFSELHTLDLTKWEGDPADSLLKPLILAIEKKSGTKPEDSPTQAIQSILTKPEEEASYWRAVSESAVQSIREYRSYLKKFGETATFSDIAKLRIEALENEKQRRWWRRWPTKTISGATAIVLLITAVANLLPTQTNRTLDTRDLSAKTESGPARQVSEQEADYPDDADPKAVDRIARFGSPHIEMASQAKERCAGTDGAVAIRAFAISIASPEKLASYINQNAAAFEGEDRAFGCLSGLMAKAEIIQASDPTQIDIATAVVLNSGPTINDTIRSISEGRVDIDAVEIHDTLDGNFKSSTELMAEVQMLMHKWKQQNELEANLAKSLQDLAMTPITDIR